MNKILVVVDMQNDFITGPLGTPEAVSIVDKVVEKIREYDTDFLVNAFMDTHNDDYLNTQEGKNLPVVHCVIDSKGHKINHKVLNALRKKGYQYWLKSTFGNFRYCESLKDTVNAYGERNIEITLVGVCTDICVISNALLLKAHYPEMKIVVDAACCAGSSPEKHRMALEVMKSCQIDILNEVSEDQADVVNVR
jgi:nicotinamidase-related amidase